MTDSLPRSERDIPTLRLFVDRLFLLANEAMHTHICYDEADHLAFMSLSFVSKQIDHLKTIRILVDMGQHKDAELIARSMIEGLFLLLWVTHDPSTRPLLWRSYAIVEDFRLMRKKEQAGETIDSSHKQNIDEQLNIYGSQFFTNKARTAQKEGLPLPQDPYRKNWTGKTIREICEEVEGVNLYEKIYCETSEWIHWTPRGLGSAIRRKGEMVHYYQQSTESEATALACAFQALLESLVLLDSHLNLGFSNNLKELRNTYIETLTIDK